MISDTLFEAAASIEDGLKTFPQAYQGAIRQRLEKLLVEMKEIQSILDTPPRSADERLN